jgi:hypothetical protein
MTEADVIFFAFTHLNAPIGALKGLVRISYCIKLVYRVCQKVYRRTGQASLDASGSTCHQRDG